MDTFTCPGCNAPLKLALVPAELPFHSEFTPAEGPVPEPAAAATSEPETAAPSPLAERPDVVARKQGVVRNNEETAVLLKRFIEAGGAWYDPLPSPDIFDRFQAWCEREYGWRQEHITKHRISKVLVDQLGATWHKTGKGRMYQLPDGLRPSSRPVSEDFPTVPVGPAPTTPAPGGLEVVYDSAVPRGNVYLLPQRPVHAVDPTKEQDPELVFDGGVVRAVGQDTEGRCSAWLLAKGVPALQCELPEEHNAVEDGMGHRAGGYWWDATGHGRLQEDGPAPFVDFPETTTGGEVSVTEGGVFGADGERLPGDDEPNAATKAVIEGRLEEANGGLEAYERRHETAESAKPLTVVHTEGEIDAARNSYAVGLESGLARPPMPGDIIAGATVVAAVPAASQIPGYAEGGKVADVVLENVSVDDGGNVTAEGTFPAAVAAELPAPNLSVDFTAMPEPEFGALVKAAVDAAAAKQEAPVIHELPADPALPEGARLCSVQLSEEQIGWPLRRIAAIFDDFAGRQGLVRLGALADIELRKIMSQRYATAMVCPAGNEPAEPDADPAPADTPEPAPVAPFASLMADGRYGLPLTPDEAGLPFGALEDIFAGRLPEGVVADGSPLELLTGASPSGVILVGAVAAAAAPAADVVGEDLQGLVSAPDAAADALAAYRAASRGLSVPDHVTDEGDWG